MFKLIRKDRYVVKQLGLLGSHITDKNIVDKSYYPKTFPGFPSLGVKNCFLFKVRLLVLSNSLLPQMEIQEMFH